MKEYYYGREYVVGGHNANTIINDEDKCISPIALYNNKKI